MQKAETLPASTELWRDGEEKSEAAISLFRKNHCEQDRAIMLRGLFWRSGGGGGGGWRHGG